MDPPKSRQVNTLGSLGRSGWESRPVEIRQLASATRTTNGPAGSPGVGSNVRESLSSSTGPMPSIVDRSRIPTVSKNFGCRVSGNRDSDHSQGW